MSGRMTRLHCVPRLQQVKSVLNFLASAFIPACAMSMAFRTVFLPILVAHALGGAWLPEEQESYCWAFPSNQWARGPLSAPRAPDFDIELMIHTCSCLYERDFLLHDRARDTNDSGDEYNVAARDEARQHQNQTQTEKVDEKPTDAHAQQDTTCDLTVLAQRAKRRSRTRSRSSSPGGEDREERKATGQEGGIGSGNPPGPHRPSERCHHGELAKHSRIMTRAGRTGQQGQVRGRGDQGRAEAEQRQPLKRRQATQDRPQHQ